MLDSASKSLNAILEGLRTGEFVEIPDVPVFDLHDEHDMRRYVRDAKGQQVANPDYGKLLQRFDHDRLQRIVANCNRRAEETGDLAPIGPGHTIPGYAVPETSQPPIYGYAGEYKVGTYGPGGRTGILTKLYARKEHEEDVKKAYPRRSIELVPGEDFIDWIALLRRSPQRDLGLLTYSREASEAIQQRFSPWENEKYQPVFNALGAPLHGCYSPDGKLRYSLDFFEERSMTPQQVPGAQQNMGQQPPMQPQQSSQPPAPQMDALSPDEMLQAQRFWNHYMRGEAVRAMGNGQPAYPSPQNTTMPNPSPAPVGTIPEDDRMRMAREQEAIRYGRLEQELAQIKTEREAEKVRYQRDAFERPLIQLEAEGCEFDRAHELETMLRLPDEASRTQHLERLRRYNRVGPANTNVGWLDTGAPPQGDDLHGNVPMQRFREAQRYMRDHPGKSWDQSLAECPQGYVSGMNGFAVRN